MEEFACGILSFLFFRLRPRTQSSLHQDRLAPAFRHREFLWYLRVILLHPPRAHMEQKGQAEVRDVLLDFLLRYFDHWWLGRRDSKIGVPMELGLAFYHAPHLFSFDLAPFARGLVHRRSAESD